MLSSKIHTLSLIVGLSLLSFTGLAMADSVGVKLDAKTLNSSTVPGTNIVAAPYYLDVNSVSNDSYFKVGQQLTVICDDYNHDVQVNETWTADVLSLNAVISQTAAVPNWVNPTPTVQQYEEAAWLMQQTALWGSPTFFDQTNTANNVQNINEAIWNLMEFSGTSHPAGWTTGTGNNSAASWQADALAHYADMCGQTLCDQNFYSDVVILTPELNSQSPLNDGPPQQYLTVVTPEPASLVLFGTGLLGAFSQRKRLRSKIV